MVLSLTPMTPTRSAIVARRCLVNTDRMRPGVFSDAFSDVFSDVRRKPGLQRFLDSFLGSVLGSSGGVSPQSSPQVSSPSRRKPVCRPDDEHAGGVVVPRVVHGGPRLGRIA